MVGVEGQAASAEVVAKWRAPLEITALILLAAIGFSIVGGIVNAVFSPDASGWDKLRFLGFNVVSLWHIAVLAVAVALVFALRLPFAPDAGGAATARTALLGSVVLGGVIAVCALLGVIGTIGETGEFEATVPEKLGEVMQFLGGGGAAAAAGLLALRGRSLVPAPVRPVRAPAPPAPAPAAAAPGSPGWAGDPYGRHQWRYWDGTRWTDQVADGSTESTDRAG
jgi:hypothetical protein